MSKPEWICSIVSCLKLEDTWKINENQNSPRIFGVDLELWLYPQPFYRRETPGDLNDRSLIFATGEGKGILAT